MDIHKTDRLRMVPEDGRDSSVQGGIIVMCTEGMPSV